METHAKTTVFLDMGGTLVKPSPPVGEVYSYFAFEYGLDVKADVIGEAFSKALNDKQKDCPLVSAEQEVVWWRDLVNSVVSPYGTLRDSEGFFAALWEYFTRPDSWEIFSDTFPTLQALRDREIRIALVSNWDSRLVKLCDDLNISPFLQGLFVSALSGSAKPERTFFDHALAQCGVSASEVLHVGDSVEMDWYGARNAGIDALVIDRKDRVNGSVTKVHSLSEVLDYL